MHGAEAVVGVIAERGAVGVDLRAVDREPLAVGAFVHEQGRRSADAGQQPAAKQLQTERAEVRRPQRGADASRKPRQQVILVRLHLDRVADLADVELVRVERVGGERLRLRSGAAADAPRAIQPAAPPTTNATTAAAAAIAPHERRRPHDRARASAGPAPARRSPRHSAREWPRPARASLRRGRLPPDGLQATSRRLRGDPPAVRRRHRRAIRLLSPVCVVIDHE